MGTVAKTKREGAGFTLVELLVVVSIIALLISILLPSLKDARQQAQAVVCAANAKQLATALFTYQLEFRGYLPANLWSERDWGVQKPDLWFYKLFPTYLGDPKAMICPGDPFRSRFDFEASFPTPNFPRRSNARANSCGYGMNYAFRHFGEPYSFNTERYPPTHPDRVIMFAEVGPDNENNTAPLPDALFRVGRPWRDGGRLVWDDGARPWYAGPTWLTDRHNGGINMTSLDGAVHRVLTTRWLRRRPDGSSPIETRYERGVTGDCTFCNLSEPGKMYGGTTWSEEPHYCFYTATLYWWTGPFPKYPN